MSGPIFFFQYRADKIMKICQGNSPQELRKKPVPNLFFVFCKTIDLMSCKESGENRKKKRDSLRSPRRVFGLVQNCTSSPEQDLRGPRRAARNSYVARGLGSAQKRLGLAQKRLGSGF